jgi:hypothetical protein
MAYPASARGHSETVLRGFSDFHRDTGTGPVLNAGKNAGQRRTVARRHSRELWGYYIS